MTCEYLLLHTNIVIHIEYITTSEEIDCSALAAILERSVQIAHQRSIIGR